MVQWRVAGGFGQAKLKAFSSVNSRSELESDEGDYEVRSAGWRPVFFKR